MNPFDYVESINSSKKDLMVDAATEKAYNAFLVNRALSYFKDTVLYANEMNMHHHIDAKLQYQYYLNTIRPSKRYSKWAKKKEDNDIDAIIEYYGYNYKNAKATLSILSKQQLKIIKERLEKGGTK